MDPEEALDHPVLDFQGHLDDHHLEPEVVQAY